MKTSHKNPLIAYHDHVAGIYDSMYQDNYWNFYRNLTWEIIKGHLPREHGVPVIDFGCGTGYWGLKLAKSGYAVTFLDISHKMLEQARRKAQEADCYEKCQFIQADICNLENLEKNHYHFAIGEGDPISLCSDSKKALRELKTILAPQGTLVTSVDNTCSGIDHYLKQSDLKGLEGFIKTGKTPWLARDPKERFITTMFTPEQSKKLFETNGFKNVLLRGKTILPLRKNQELLSDRKNIQRLIQIELKLNKIEAYLGKASHLQVIAQKDD